MIQNDRKKVTIIGAGLAGSEAAYQLAKRQVEVDLYEMRPTKESPAHKTDLFAELVCSNSLRANNIENAVGVLKEEMRRLDSLIMKCADACSVPAGGALAVDRHQFSELVTKTVTEMDGVTIKREEVTAIPEEGPVIIATGPLTADKLAQEISSLTGTDALYFYDAAAPIVTAESLNRDIVFEASRYGKGDADYMNCPMSKEEFLTFIHALIEAECTTLHAFEKETFFEGCMPVEVLAKRGEDTLRYGPLKPVGLVDPRTGKEPYAVVQLRKENQEGTMYNLVGFQTHLKWGEQKRVFSLIPGLEECEFLRYGVMHRNTYLHSPSFLNRHYQCLENERLFFVGQMTGVEGYIESAASGLLGSLAVSRLLEQKEPIDFSNRTAIGALSHYISSYDGKNFQPMNVNFGIMEGWPKKVKPKREKNKLIALRALEEIDNIVKKEFTND